MSKSPKHTSGSNRLAAVCPHEHVVLAELTPVARRTRTHPGLKRRMVEASIVEHGILNPLAVNAAGVIVDGHLRYEIAKELCLQTFPVIRIEHLSDAELRAYVIAANKLPSVAHVDVDALRIEIEEIRAEVQTLDLSMTGFSIGEIDKIIGHHKAGLYDDLDDELAEDAVPPVAKRGGLYIRGDHRPICGDSLDPSVIGRLMDGELARAAFLDPPYNVKINGHVSGSGDHEEFAMASGEMSADEFVVFLKRAFENVTAVLANGAISFVCIDHTHVRELVTAGDAVFAKRLRPAAC